MNLPVIKVMMNRKYYFNTLNFITITVLLLSTLIPQQDYLHRYKIFSIWALKYIYTTSFNDDKNISLKNIRLTGDGGCLEMINENSKI